jgi:peptidyl-prolyl cis-trans isomerase A (cyclophilin A)
MTEEHTPEMTYASAMKKSFSVFVAAALAMAAAACAPETAGNPPVAPTSGGGAPEPAPLGGTAASPAAANTEQAAPGSVAGSGTLVATIETQVAPLRCRLFEDKAPNTVQNFVGLAQGTKAWKDWNGAWVNKPAYDGTTFHRIIKGFMIQGGDANGPHLGAPGTGEPGFVIDDEIWKGATHDRPGLLCMANRGPNTNGMQFFITDAPAPNLDGNYTIFGECGPVDVIHKLADWPVNGDKAINPPVIKTVTIAREAAQ